MINTEEILSKHIDKESMDELSVNVWPDMIDAMKEYAREACKEQREMCGTEYFNQTIETNHFHKVIELAINHAPEPELK